MDTILSDSGYCRMASELAVLFTSCFGEQEPNSSETPSSFSCEAYMYKNISSISISKSSAGPHNEHLSLYTCPRKKQLRISWH